MYHLIVTGSDVGREPLRLEMDRVRFLEYTSGDIAGQLRSLSEEAIHSIKSWPCLVMQEGRGQERVRIAKIVKLARSSGGVEVVVAPIASQAQVLNSLLWRARVEFDIGEFEFGRNHWSVKNRDIFSVLEGNGVSLEAGIVDQFGSLALPAPARAQVIRAKKEVEQWSHSDIDEFLLEAGVDRLVAGRECGSRRDRAAAIAEFILDNPGEVTAENSLFSLFFLRKALSRADLTKDLEVDLDFGGVKGRANYSPAKDSLGRSPNRVFVVHGRNTAAREAIVEFLASKGLVGIVLHDMPNMGRHLLTKFIDEAELVTFAVILMTDDDVGAVKGESLRPRARQNVILELGYFLSHLGQGRVCALITPELETPSDFDGIVYIGMDGSGRWRKELERELRAAGMPLAK